MIVIILFRQVWGMARGDDRMYMSLKIMVARCLRACPKNSSRPREEAEGEAVVAKNSPPTPKIPTPLTPAPLPRGLGDLALRRTAAVGGSRAQPQRVERVP